MATSIDLLETIWKHYSHLVPLIAKHLDPQDFTTLAFYFIDNLPLFLSPQHEPWLKLDVCLSHLFIQHHGTSLLGVNDMQRCVASVDIKSQNWLPTSTLHILHEMNYKINTSSDEDYYYTELIAHKLVCARLIGLCDTPLVHKWMPNLVFWDRHGFLHQRLVSHLENKGVTNPQELVATIGFDVNMVGSTVLQALLYNTNWEGSDIDMAVYGDEFPRDLQEYLDTYTISVPRNSAHRQGALHPQYYINGLKTRCYQFLWPSGLSMDIILVPEPCDSNIAKTFDIDVCKVSVDTDEDNVLRVFGFKPVQLMHRRHDSRVEDELDAQRVSKYQQRGITFATGKKRRKKAWSVHFLSHDWSCTVMVVQTPIQAMLDPESCVTGMTC